MVPKRTDRAMVTMQTGYLYFVQDSSAVHPARHIHGVAPDIILRLLSSDYTSDHRSMVHTCDTSEWGYHDSNDSNCLQQKHFTRSP